MWRGPILPAAASVAVAAAAAAAAAAAVEGSTVATVAATKSVAAATMAATATASVGRVAVRPRRAVASSAGPRRVRSVGPRWWCATAAPAPVLAVVGGGAAARVVGPLLAKVAPLDSTAPSLRRAAKRRGLLLHLLCTIAWLVPLAAPSQVGVRLPWLAISVAIASGLALILRLARRRARARR